MVTLIDYLFASHVYRLDQVGVTGKYPAIDQIILYAPVKTRLLCVQRDKIGTISGFDTADFTSAGQSPAA